MEQQARILNIVRQVAGKPVSPATDESLFESGLLDSFLTDLVSAIEAEFRISVPDSDLTPRKFDSIGTSGIWRSDRRVHSPIWLVLTSRVVTNAEMAPVVGHGSMAIANDGYRRAPVRRAA